MKRYKYKHHPKTGVSELPWGTDKREQMLDPHHVWGAANRKLSDHYDLVIYVTRAEHGEIEKDIEQRTKLRVIYRKKFEEQNPTLDFIGIFERRYGL